MERTKREKPFGIRLPKGVKKYLDAFDNKSKRIIFILERFIANCTVIQMANGDYVVEQKGMERADETPQVRPVIATHDWTPMPSVISGLRSIQDNVMKKTASQLWPIVKDKKYYRDLNNWQIIHRDGGFVSDEHWWLDIEEAKKVLRLEHFTILP